MSSSWSQLGLKIGAAITVPIVAVLGLASLRWRSSTEAMRARLRSGARPPAAAAYSTHGLEGLPEFRFGANGLIESMFVPGRLFDDGKHPPTVRPWQGRHLSEVSMHGVMVPADSVVEWLLPEGVYAYWRGRPTAIEYEYATH